MEETQIKMWVMNKEEMIMNNMNGNLYAAHMGYTDINPYEVVKVVSDICLEVREMDHEADPNDRPQFVPGGFSAICTHFGSRIITKNPNNPVIRIRRTKRNPEVWVHKGRRFRLTFKPQAYYDYNF